MIMDVKTFMDSKSSENSSIAKDTNAIVASGDASLAHIMGARLHAGVENDNLEMVMECVKSATAAEVNWINQDESEGTALNNACVRGHTAIVRVLLGHQDIDVNLQGQNKCAPLLVASVSGHTEILQMLLMHPLIEVNLQRKNGYTALIEACTTGQTSCVSALIAHPDVNVNSQDEDGCTALMWACRDNRLECITCLLAHRNIDVQVEDKCNRTALDWALAPDARKLIRAHLKHQKTGSQVRFGGLFGTVNRLLNRKEPAPTAPPPLKWTAPPPLKSTHRITCDASIVSAAESDTSIVGARLYMAVSNNNPEIVLECVRSATAAEINWINKDEREGTALINACVRGYKAIVRTLLEHPDIDVNLQGQSQCAPLMTASIFEDTEIMQMLLAHPHININQREMDGRTALMWACSGNHVQCVKLLLAHRDIDVHIRDKVEWTALQWAQKPEAGKLMRAYLKKHKTVDVARSDGLFGAVSKLFGHKDSQPPISHPPAPTAVAPAAALVAAPQDPPLVLQEPQQQAPEPPRMEANTSIKTPLTATVKNEKSSYSGPEADKVASSPKLASASADPSAAELTAADRAALDAFLQSEANGVLNVVVSKITAHDRALELLVNKRKECPSLFWFYPKKRELRNWLRDPLKCLLQDSLMMVVVCPVTLRVVRCGPDGVGWEISAPKAWVKKWGPAILFSIYVMQAAVLAGRVVGLPLPQLPDVGAAANALGLLCDDANQKQLMLCLSKFASTTEDLLKEQSELVNSLIERMHHQQKIHESQDHYTSTPSEEHRITLDPGMPTQMFEDSYRSIHTFLTTGDNARLGKLEDQPRGSMERVLAEDGDVEWVSTEAVEVWRKKHALMREAHVAQEWSHAPAPRQEIRVSQPVCTPVVTHRAVEEAPSSAQPTSSWLAVRLRQKGVKEELVLD